MQSVCNYSLFTGFVMYLAHVFLLFKFKYKIGKNITDPRVKMKIGW